MENKEAKVYPDHVVRDGLRFLDPYYHDYASFCKKRWIGVKLLDLCIREFKGETAEYFAKAIEDGRFTINGEKASPDYVMTDNDVINHRSHRHEPAILDQEIRIIRQTNDVLVVDKPCSLSVHACGRYNYSTIVSRLEQEHNLTNLKIIHRLDRLTSGVLILGKSLRATHLFEDQIKRRIVSKCYLSLVRGAYKPDKSIIDCHERLLTVSPRLGVVEVDTIDGKESHTKFIPLTTVPDPHDANKTNTVVLCLPSTGRTHQIRVHLLSLGHPIANDPIYSHSCWDDSTLSREQRIELLVEELAGSPEETVNEDVPSAKRVKIDKNDDTNKDNNEQTSKDESEGENIANTNISRGELLLAKAVKEGKMDEVVAERRKQNLDKYCTECLTIRPRPKVDDMILYLHAYKYTGNGWSYTASIPPWAATGGVTEKMINEALDLIPNEDRAKYYLDPLPNAASEVSITAKSD